MKTNKHTQPKTMTTTTTTPVNPSRLKLLMEIYQKTSPSLHENQIQALIKEKLSQIESATWTTDRAGNIYVTKGISDTYPCIAAHMDEVHHHASDYTPVSFAVDGDFIIMGWSKLKGGSDGLGADDKNGIYIALQALMDFDIMKAVFFVGEEIGCVGSSRADLAFFSDCRFVIECDRRGNSDFITSISGDLCSDEFIQDCRIGDFGYHEEFGLMTDVDTLKNNGLGISCCNISCGYYNPHTKYEYTSLRDLVHCYDFVCSIIENCTKVYPHESCELFTGKYSYGWMGDDWNTPYNDNIPETGSALDDLTYALWDMYFDGCSKRNIRKYVKKFIRNNPKIKIQDIESAYYEVMGESINYTTKKA